MIEGLTDKLSYSNLDSNTLKWKWIMTVLWICWWLLCKDLWL